MCTKCMLQNADNQNCWWRLRCCLNVSSKSASATSYGTAFQAGMVRGRNAYLNASTTGWKRRNCMVWHSCCVLQTWCRIVFLWNFNQPICDLVHHGQSVVESTSLQAFPSEIRHHRRYRDGWFAASKGNVLHKLGCSALSHFQLIDIFLLIRVPNAGTVFQLGTDDSFVSLFLQVFRTPIQSMSEKA